MGQCSEPEGKRNAMISSIFREECYTTAEPTRKPIVETEICMKK